AIARGPHGRPSGYADLSFHARRRACVPALSEVHSGAVSASPWPAGGVVVGLTAPLPGWVHFRAQLIQIIIASVAVLYQSVIALTAGDQRHDQAHPRQSRSRARISGQALHWNVRANVPLRCPP